MESSLEFVFKSLDNVEVQAKFSDPPSEYFQKYKEVVIKVLVDTYFFLFFARVEHMTMTTQTTILFSSNFLGSRLFQGETVQELVEECQRLGYFKYLLLGHFNPPLDL